MSRPISFSQTTLAVTTGEKFRASSEIRGLRNVSCDMSGAWACSSARASSMPTTLPRELWNREKSSARDSGASRLAMAAYFSADTSASGVLPCFSSATTMRPSPSSPRMCRRSGGMAGPPQPRSKSSVTILTAFPRIWGLERIHSWRSARSSNPASSSEIISAGIATDPATVNSMSSAMRGQAMPDARWREGIGNGVEVSKLSENACNWRD